MGTKSEEFRAQARRLAERADTAANENIRMTLISAAQRWHDLAQDVERYEMEGAAGASERDQQNLKAAIAALSRAVRAFWDHEKTRPLSEALAQLAAAADAACSLTSGAATDRTSLTETQSPHLSDTSFKAAADLTQVKDDRD